jgi:hypothetical protein
MTLWCEVRKVLEISEEKFDISTDNAPTVLILYLLGNAY